ncbi:MAG TPA: GNAT family N-acetyltransferase [Polyangiales bacterium]|nr:GNAT family N-acetyltransferase [Polyangiales bacterium]
MAGQAKVSLRPEARSDRDLLLRVYASTRQSELELVPWSEADKRAFVRWQFEAQHQHYHRHYANAEYSIVLSHGVPAGRLYVARGSHELRVIDITLLPEFRGYGIGTALLLQLADEAHAASLPLTVHVEHHNPALSLYTRLGFERVSDDGVYLLMAWRPSHVKMA